MADTKVSALTAASAAAGANELPINEAGTSKKLTVQQIADFVQASTFTRVSGNSGAAGPYKTLQVLTANSADQTSTTPGTVITTTGVGAGTWHFSYSLIFQTAATTTGIKIANNHTGTVTTYIMHSDFVSTGGTAGTGIHDAIAAVATSGLHEGHGERVINASSKATAGVATAAANQFIVVRGIVVVSATGSLEFKLGTEIAASAVKLMADSCLELTKIA